MAELSKLPLMPLRDVIIFPSMVIPLFIGRPKSILALELAMKNGKNEIILTTQKKASKEEPEIKDLFTIGCKAKILQLVKLPDGTAKALVEGQKRVLIKNIDEYAHKEEKNNKFFSADFIELESKTKKTQIKKIESLRRAVISKFDEYVKLLSKRLPSELLPSIANIEEPVQIADTIAVSLALKIEDKQNLLETLDVEQALEKVLFNLENEIEILNLDKKIRNQVKSQIDKTQKAFYLNEQVKAIQKELGQDEDGNDFVELEKKIKSAKMPTEAHKKAMAELKKLKMMPVMSAEATVVRNYIDVLTNLPWSKKTKIKHDLNHAEEVLNADHFGLEKVKDRILEYLAVQQRVDKVKTPILCLVGPPGVGKTSLGQSIAKATGRKYVRMALGGVRDESEIRGHRRTYIGAMPGKILHHLEKAEVKNPLFLLDEIDKLGMDFRGDPASALLEVLDPEQNNKFSDHYVELDFDLSDVMFVATSNSFDIPSALLDRMEVIRLSGYTEDEKVNIAKRYLLPKQLENNGLKVEELEIQDEAIYDIVRFYTREAGVRSLERELSKICRKVVKSLLQNQSKKKGKTKKTKIEKITVDSKNLENYLGVQKFTFGKAEAKNQIGQVSGLAWTEVGGDLLTIEVATMPGKGNILRTGSLGDVMKESVEAARTVVRSRANLLGIHEEDFEKKDVHIHVPDGATPKDGPSAGAAMTTAFVSALARIPVKSDVAMTGEITLRGEVTAIGGLKEKLLAALRGGIKTVIIPQENVKDLAEIPENVKTDLKIMPVRWIDEVLKIALEYEPIPIESPLILPTEKKENIEKTVDLIAIETKKNKSVRNIKH